MAARKDMYAAIDGAIETMEYVLSQYKNSIDIHSIESLKESIATSKEAMKKARGEK